MRTGRTHGTTHGIESIAAVLGADEVGEQVVVQGVATSGDHVVDVASD